MSDKRTHIAKEVLSTERTFVKNLKTIVDVFLLPLRLAVEDGRPIIKTRHIEQIFSNIEEIMCVSVQLLGMLEQRLEIWNENPCIGDVFMEVLPNFGVYDKYLMDHHQAIVKITELEKRGPFAQFLATAKERPECENLDVLAMLITPVQRILRYKLLLEDMIKHTPDGHQDKPDLTAALAFILEKAKAVNEGIKAAENYEKLIIIQKSFITGNVKNLVEQSRWFVREGNLTKVCRKVPKRRWFFLFSDILIYASVVTQSGGGNLYSFHRMLQLNKTKVKSVPDTDTQKNAFQIITNDKSFTVFADTPEEKDTWLNDLNKTMGAANSSPGDSGSAPVWEPDGSADLCRICHCSFTRHHCRQCGNLVCGTCSTGRTILPHSTDFKAVRVCDECLPPSNLNGQSSLPISNPTISFSSSDHAPSGTSPGGVSSTPPSVSSVPAAPATTSPTSRQNVAQIMKDSASLTRMSSRAGGLKPPSNPLPPTPMQHQSGTHQPPSYAPPVPGAAVGAKNSKPMPPVPHPSMKRTVSVLNADSPPLPPKPVSSAPRASFIAPSPAPNVPPPTPPSETTAYPSSPSHDSSAPRAIISGDNLESEVQVLLANLQKMFKTEPAVANLPLIEKVRYFSNKVNSELLSSSPSNYNNNNNSTSPTSPSPVTTLKPSTLRANSTLSPTPPAAYKSSATLPVVPPRKASTAILVDGRSVA